MKKQSIKMLSLGLVLSMLMLCIGFLSLNDVAFAEGVQPAFESFTDTDEYYYNETEYKIADYEASMHKGNALNYIVDENYGESGKYACTIKYAQDPVTNIMRLIASGDDPITQIVPKYLFQSANNGIVHVGVEYYRCTFVFYFVINDKSYSIWVEQDTWKNRYEDIAEAEDSVIR